jgi:hypothetical protein
MPTRTQNVYQHVLNNPIHEGEDTKGFSNCDDQTPPMPARTQNVSQHVLTETLKFQQKNILILLTKPIPCQRAKKGISKYLDHTPPMPAGTKILSQLVSTKPWQHRLKLYLNICRLNLSHYKTKIIHKIC